MNYTNKNQSEELIKYGLSPETSDMALLGEDIIPYNFCKCQTPDLAVPIWSLSRLLMFLPRTIIKETEIGKLSFTWVMCPWDGSKTERYAVSYIDLDRETPLWTTYGSTYIEAVLKMIIKLLENHYIDGKEKKEKEAIFITEINRSHKERK